MSCQVGHDLLDAHDRDQDPGQGQAHPAVAFGLDDADGAGLGDAEVGPADRHGHASGTSCRRWARAAAAERRGSSVRSSVLPSRRRNSSRISARFLWIAGTRMCDDRSPASWMISSARSVSMAVDADLRERLVQADLVGGQRLDLDHLLGAVAP